MRVALILLCSCVAYNNDCRLPEGVTVAELATGLDIRESTLRTQEAAVGNLVADAIASKTPGADVALVPANIFSRATACGQRDFLDRGQLTQADVDALLPSNATIVLLSVTSDDLKRALERSVAALEDSEFEGFLQVSGTLFTVDCAEAPQTLAGNQIVVPGSRISSLFIQGVPARAGQTFQLATLSNIGELGFVDLARPGMTLIDTNLTAREMVTQYLASHTVPQTEGRIIVRDTCR